MTAESEIARYRANAAKLEKAHAYSPDQEHDACGVGLVAAIDGRPRRAVVLGAIEALKSVWHRGAVDADGKTGDGAGIHLQVPQDFFRAQVERAGTRLRSGRIAVGISEQVGRNQPDDLELDAVRVFRVQRFGRAVIGRADETET